MKSQNATCLARSEFLGAYLGQELIGFIKLIYVGDIAMIIQILSKNEHRDKRPNNALIAKAVAVCEGKGISLLVYGKYVYGRNERSSLTEFKRRNGFKEVSFPRYFVPLTSRGWWIIKSGLHRGLKDFIPRPMIWLLLEMRSRFYH